MIGRMARGSIPHSRRLGGCFFCVAALVLCVAPGNAMRTAPLADGGLTLTVPVAKLPRGLYTVGQHPVRNRTPMALLTERAYS